MRGICSLLLVLLSWILPVTTMIVAAFLASLPLTGLEALWATKSATAVLLGAAAALVVLINAAYQNGEVAGGTQRVIRISARAAALLLLPIAAIAVYSLGLRVDAYGWTVDRIIAAACLLVASCYALGYARAALQPSGWLLLIAPVNVAAAYVILAILLGLFSPLADPARISVNNQVERLLSGTTRADKFDFEYLKFQGVRYGQAALEHLKQHTAGPDAETIRDKAQRVIAQKRPTHRDAGNVSEAQIAANITVWPPQKKLPESFLRQNWSAYKELWALPHCLYLAGKPCDAILVDINSDGREEVVLLPHEALRAPAVLQQEANGNWLIFGNLPRELTDCKALHQRVLTGQFSLVAPQVKDLELDGQRIEIQRHQHQSGLKCPA